MPYQLKKTEKIPIVPTKALRTFDFADMQGTPQTDEANDAIHEQIIEHPEEPMVEGGESFQAAADRVLPEMNKILGSDRHAIVTTHNSVYGMIKLWDEMGQPKYLTKEFRERYVEQDNTNPTGSHFIIQYDNTMNNKRQIIICRHGETSDNKDGNFRTHNAELTEKGREQAKEAGEEIKDKKVNIIYSSDLPRAMETSEIVRNVLIPKKKPWIVKK